MLKTVSSITNAIGALNYKGTWNANTNSPALASGVGTKGDYYVVSVAGTTTLDGISNWGIGDWVTFNGSVWQRVEGGADLNGVNLSVSGTSTLGGNATFKDNLTQDTAGKGINFTANANAPGMTSELLNWYEAGTWSPVAADAVTGGNTSATTGFGYYTRIGRQVTCIFLINNINTTGLTAGNIFYIQGLPFTVGVLGSQSHGSVAVAQTTFTGQLNLEPPESFKAVRITKSISGNDISYVRCSDLTSGAADIQGAFTYFV